MTVIAGALHVNDFHLFVEGGHAHVLVIPTSALYRVDAEGRRLLTALLDQRRGVFSPLPWERIPPFPPPWIRSPWRRWWPSSDPWTSW